MTAESERLLAAALAALDLFLLGLRPRGYAVTADVLAEIRSLLLGAARRWPEEWPRRAALLAGPVVCKSGRQQDEFPGLWRDWLDGLDRSLTAKARERDTDAKTTELFTTTKRRWPRRKLYVMLLLAEIAIALVLVFYHAPATVSGTAHADHVLPAPQPDVVGKSVPPSSRSLGLMAAGASAALLSFVALRWLKRGQLLRRRRARGLPRVIAPALDQVLPPKDVSLAAREMRRRAPPAQQVSDLPLSMRVINVAETVTRTIENGGWLTEVASARLDLPQYLFLIQSSGQRDLLAEYLDRIRARLGLHGVLIDAYGFTDTPQWCQPLQGRNRAGRLSELAERYPEHRLVLVADAGVLVEPVFGHPQPWVAALQHWRERTLLTPVMQEAWGLKERRAQRLLRVLPADLASLQTVPRTAAVRPEAARAEPRRSFQQRRLPPSLRESGLRWLAPRRPPLAEVGLLMADLRQYLGPDGLLLLCACARYPEVRSDLVLHLANHLGLATHLDFTRFFRLPWMRESYLPNWLRQRLLAEPTRQEIRTIDRVLQAALLDAQLAADSGGWTVATATAEGSQEEREQVMADLGPSWLAGLRRLCVRVPERLAVRLRQGETPAALTVGAARVALVATAASVKRMIQRVAGAVWDAARRLGRWAALQWEGARVRLEALQDWLQRPKEVPPKAPRKKKDGDDLYQQYRRRRETIIEQTWLGDEAAIARKPFFSWFTLRMFSLWVGVHALLFAALSYGDVAEVTFPQPMPTLIAVLFTQQFLLARYLGLRRPWWPILSAAVAILVWIVQLKFGTGQHESIWAFGMLAGIGLVQTLMLPAGWTRWLWVFTYFGIALGDHSSQEDLPAILFEGVKDGTLASLISGIVFARLAGISARERRTNTVGSWPRLILAFAVATAGAGYGTSFANANLDYLQTRYFGLAEFAEGWQLLFHSPLYALLVHVSASIGFAMLYPAPPHKSGGGSFRERHPRIAFLAAGAAGLIGALISLWSVAGNLPAGWDKSDPMTQWQVLIPVALLPVLFQRFAMPSLPKVWPLLQAAFVGFCLYYGSLTHSTPGNAASLVLGLLFLLSPIFLRAVTPERPGMDRDLNGKTAIRHYGDVESEGAESYPRFAAARDYLDSLAARKRLERRWVWRLLAWMLWHGALIFGAGHLAALVMRLSNAWPITQGSPAVTVELIALGWLALEVPGLLISWQKRKDELDEEDVLIRNWLLALAGALTFAGVIWVGYQSDKGDGIRWELPALAFIAARFALAFRFGIPLYALVVEAMLLVNVGYDDPLGSLSKSLAESTGTWTLGFVLFGLGCLRATCLLPRIRS